MLLITPACYLCAGAKSIFNRSDASFARRVVNETPLKRKAKGD